MNRAGDHRAPHEEAIDPRARPANWPTRGRRPFDNVKTVIHVLPQPEGSGQRLRAQDPVEEIALQPVAGLR